MERVILSPETIQHARHRKDREEMRALIESFSYKADIIDNDFIGGNESNDIDELLQKSDPSSLWKKSKKQVEVRPRGWLKRFAGKLDESCIKPSKKNPLWMGLLPKHRLAPLSNTSSNADQLDILKAPPPAAPLNDDADNLPKFQDSSKMSNLCYLCWGAVSLGQRVCCVSCPVISHQRCVLDIKEYLISRTHTSSSLSSPSLSLSPSLTSPIENKAKVKEKLDDEEEENGKGKEEEEAENEVEKERRKASLPSSPWQCPFCLETVQRRNQHANLKYLSFRIKYEQTKACIKLQSFFRMIPRRLRYLKGKMVALTMQRRLRSKMFWKKKQREESRKKRPFRLQIHSLKAFVHYGGRGLEHYEEFPVLPNGNPIKVGEVAANLYDQFVSGAEVTVDEKSEAVCHFLAKEAPPFPPVNLRTYNLLNVLPKGSLVCTVTISCNSSNSGEETLRQIGRIDVPVVLMKRSVLQKITPDMLPQLGISVDPNDENYSPVRNKLLCDEFRIATLVPLKSNLILIPACNSFCTIKITLSQVHRYPKTYFVGQCEQNINQFLMWKKCATWIHPMLFNNIDIPDFPQPDHESRIDVRERAQPKSNTKIPNYCRPSTTSTNETGKNGNSGWTHTKGDAASTTASHVTPVALTARQHDNIVDDDKGLDENDDEGDESISLTDGKYAAFGGIAHWSLRAVSFEGLDEAGEILYCSTGQVITSDKRKCWAVLVDSILYIFGNLTANIEFYCKEEHNLKTCSVGCGTDGMIKVRSSTLIFLLGTSPKSTANWYRKIYKNSHSNVHKPWDDKWLMKGGGGGGGGPEK